ncbi:hypothetical protein, partial [Paenibacillus sp. 598K]|uniref:hypothetical protein n=1 Tax=Paenibacillus sp. 598K TaxID=1117987 RepID=UPI001C876C9A
MGNQRSRTLALIATAALLVVLAAVALWPRGEAPEAPVAAGETAAETSVESGAEATGAGTNQQSEGPAADEEEPPAEAAA